ncbi:shikimate dehydrogenase [Thermoanaerobacter uzonensis DSM 18761]|uniref:Shikimate dehydrogenase (NADP(+)) n=1 Tax=Thermoanaerobacter uzonensis DSM 18761 TaxID=1123369 RepID=A0A1M4VAS4_9THEO|nr:shikimate dehydrogenase [Thermoanaerobacter uzonensis]SHE66042.1 shikimate dehydrogenase [Thermoanaerobacter uzonensis DSM 18761]
MKINANTKLYGLIGHPVEHSLSPLIHNYAFNSLDLNCVYTVFDVLPEKLEEAVKGVKALGIRGVNVTVPHKEKIIEYLDVVSEEALKIGAVNTVVNEEGILKGYNTDVYGFIDSLIEAGEKIERRKAVVLGAGGASKAVCVALALDGIDSIIVANRSVERAKDLSEYIKKEFKIPCDYCSINEVEEIPEIDMLVNTTSVGMYPKVEDSPVSEKVVSKAKFVYDVIYNPLETVFLKYAKKNGIKYSNGLSMLVNQANYSFKLWTGGFFDKNLVYMHLKEGIMNNL